MNRPTLTVLLTSTVLLAAAGVAVAKGGAGQQMTFEELDADGSGEITTEDLVTLRENRFGEIDADGNGSVTKEEFAAYSAAKSAERANQMFDRLDADGDGILSRDVLESRSGGRDMGGRMIERFDADNSGGISAEEFEEAQSRMGERRKGGKRGFGKDRK